MSPGRTDPRWRARCPRGSSRRSRRPRARTAGQACRGCSRGGSCRRSRRSRPRTSGSARPAIRARARARDGGDRARVDAPRQQDAARHVRDELAPDDVVHEFADRRHGRLEVVRMRARLHPPVFGVAQAHAREAHVVAGLEVVQAAERRASRPRRPDEEAAEPHLVDPALRQRVREDRLRLGAEEHAARQRVVEERLDPQPVAHEQQLLGAAVPDRERVHAVQPLQHADAPREVGAQHDLGVALGPELVPRRRELAPQLAVVVDLAAVGEGDVLVGDHRLAPALDVDDGEAAVADRGARREPQPVVVGPAQRHLLRHRARGVALVCEVTLVVDPSGYPAHDMAPAFSSPAAARRGPCSGAGCPGPRSSRSRPSPRAPRPWCRSAAARAPARSRRSGPRSPPSRAGRAARA